jgi:CubicO group peptidase (beta-lactamase class C family)
MPVLRRHSRHRARLSELVVFGLLPFICSTDTRAQHVASPPLNKQHDVSGATLARAHELTEDDVATLMDILVPLQLRRDDLAGATVAVVKDGKLLFARGYGYADVEDKKPVVAEKTLFRVGSISKLFTWTAVMQMVEQGKVRLDADVNQYLDFTIPATYPEPITLRRLMTHTAGFEDTYKDVFVSTAEEFQPLGIYLRAHLPRRMFPPGTVPSYSNYGAALAGYIVQRVSGRPFEEYVQNSIFRPLGMTQSTFVQPLPRCLQPKLATGYGIASSPPLALQFVQTGPAGGLSTSATDIARFMIAHLQNGQFADAHILKPETAQLMHARQFSAAQTTNGMAFGFYERSVNNHRVIGHAGDLNGFHSDLYLILDANVGLFISYNSAGDRNYIDRKEVWQTFLSRYFPYDPPSPPTVISAVTDSNRVRGVYISSRRSNDSIMKPEMIADDIVVSATPEGLIQIDQEKEFNGRLTLWREVGPWLYLAVNGQEHVQFQRDPSGRLMMVTDSPYWVFQRTSLSDDKRINYVVLAAVVTILAVTLLLWPAAAFFRKRYRRPITASRAKSRLRLVTRVICLIDLLTLVAWVELLQVDPVLTARWDPLVHAVQGLALIGAVGTVAVIYQCYRAWTEPRLWVGAKAMESAIAGASIGYLWLIVNWNVMSVGLRF